MEREFKWNIKQPEDFDRIADSDFVKPLVTEEIRLEMEAAYYDTADGALSSRKWMLRVRQENEKSVVTMKTPGSGYARGEWECEGDSPEAAIETLSPA